MATMEELDGVFSDHPSLSASLEDYARSELNQSPRFGQLYPSQHSGFKSESEAGSIETDSGGGCKLSWDFSVRF